MNSFHLYFTLKQRIRQYWPDLNRARARNIAMLLAALSTERDSRFHKLAPHLPLGKKNDSQIQRIRRFLQNQKVDPEELFPVVGRQVLQHFEGEEVFLLVDGTSLERQRMLWFVALAYRGRALPLAWVAKLRNGCLDSSEVIKLLERVRGWVPATVRVTVVGDAEFRGTPLMDQIEAWGWAFALHLKGDTRVQLPSGEWVLVRDLITAEGQRGWWPGSRLLVSGKGPWAVAVRWDEGEEHPCWIATNLPSEAATWRAYEKRMQIEEMFSDFKDRGFHLDQTNLRHADRIERLVLLIALVYIWLMWLGTWLVKRGKRRELNNRPQRTLSYFQLGLRWLKRCLVLGWRFRVEFTCYGS